MERRCKGRGWWMVRGRGRGRGRARARRRSRGRVRGGEKEERKSFKSILGKLVLETRDGV